MKGEVEKNEKSSDDGRGGHAESVGDWLRNEDMVVAVWPNNTKL